MKLAFSAFTMAVASAHSYYDGSHEAFLQEQKIELAKPIDFTSIATMQASVRHNLLGDATTYDIGSKSHKLYTGVCQALFTGNWDFYDLKSWDGYGRDLAKEAPATVTETTTTNKFYYKTCQPQWVLSKAEPGTTACSKEGYAYYAEGTACKYSFGSPYVSQLLNTTDDTDIKGINMNFGSYQKCLNDDTKFANFTIKLVCDAAGKDGVATLQGTTDYGTGCSSTATYTSKMGCATYRLPIGELFNAIGPYLGAILILVGLLMTFAGAKFLFVVISFSIGLVSVAIIFLIPYNLFVNPASSSAEGWTIAFLAIACVLAIIIVFLTYKFTKALAVPIIGAIAGVFLFLVIYSVTGIANKVSSGHIWIQIGFAVVGGLIGFFIANKLQYAVKTVGSAFIGAFLVVFGISFYAGHFLGSVGSGDGKYDPLVWAYFGGEFVLWIAGSVVQWKYFKTEKEEEMEQYDDPDDKKCCCF